MRKRLIISARRGGILPRLRAMRGRRGRLSYSGMWYGTLCAEHAAEADAHPTVFDPTLRFEIVVKGEAFLCDPDADPVSSGEHNRTPNWASTLAASMRGKGFSWAQGVARPSRSLRVFFSKMSR